MNQSKHLTARPVTPRWQRNGVRSGLIAMGVTPQMDLIIRKNPEGGGFDLYEVTFPNQQTCISTHARQSYAKTAAADYATKAYADYAETFNTRHECWFLAPSDTAQDRLDAWARAVAAGDRETALAAAQAEANEIQADRMAAATTRKANADAAAVGLTSLGVNADDAIEYAGAHAFRPGRRNWRGEVEADRCAYPDCGATEPNAVHTTPAKTAGQPEDRLQTTITPSGANSDGTPAVSPHQPVFTLTEITTTYAFQVETTKLVSERDNGRGAYYATIRPTGVAVYVVNGAVRMVTLSGPRQAPDGGDSWQQGTVTFNLAAKDTNPPAIVGWALGAVADAEKQISRPDSLTTAASDKN